MTATLCWIDHCAICNVGLVVVEQTISRHGFPAACCWPCFEPLLEHTYPPVGDEPIDGLRHGLTAAQLTKDPT